MKPIAPLLLAVLLTLPAIASDEPNQDRIAQSFDLADGGSVDVSRIAGPVEIKTGATGRVDVEIIRSAPTAEDLACGSMILDHSPAKVEISTKDNCTNVRQTQQVKLTVPRGADLNLTMIAGWLRVGSTDGMLRLDSIAGHVELTAVREARISSIAGGLKLNLSGVGERGVRVSSVTGGIDLEVPADLDAQLEAHTVTGSVRSDVPGLRLIDDSESNFHAVLGSGGPKIFVEAVMGGVKIHT